MNETISLLAVVVFNNRVVAYGVTIKELVESFEEFLGVKNTPNGKPSALYYKVYRDFKKGNSVLEYIYGDNTYIIQLVYEQPKKIKEKKRIRRTKYDDAYKQKTK